MNVCINAALLSVLAKAKQDLLDGKDKNNLNDVLPVLQSQRQALPDYKMT